MLPPFIPLAPHLSFFFPSVPSSRHFDVCNSVADNARVARARAPLSSVQPPVWPPLFSRLLFHSLFIFSRCVCAMYRDIHHGNRESKLLLTSVLHKTSNPSPFSTRRRGSYSNQTPDSGGTFCLVSRRYGRDLLMVMGVEPRRVGYAPRIVGSRARARTPGVAGITCLRCAPGGQEGGR